MRSRRREQEPDFTLRVASAPAYLIAMVAAASSAGAVFVLFSTGVLVTTLNSGGSRPVAESKTLVYVFLPLVAMVLLAAGAWMALLARTEFRLLRHPPVFTADGVRLRVFSGRGFTVFIPWERVARLWIGHRGARPYLGIAADRAQDLVGEDAAHHDHLRRTAERYDGADFVYALRDALVPAEELDTVVRRLSAGRVTVEH